MDYEFIKSRLAPCRLHCGKIDSVEVMRGWDNK